MVITGKTLVCGIIGDPVEHSLSPVMHNAAFRELDIDCVYVPFRVLAQSLGVAVCGLQSLGALGFNVTVPHKVEVIKHLHSLSALARRIGAVNTVLNTKKGLIGYNTDAVGAIEALRQSGVHLNDSTFTILGAGGAARAIVFALARISQRIVVLNRTIAKAQKLRQDVKRKLRKNIEVGPLTEKSLAKTLPTTDVLLNATSVGMDGHPKRFPFKQMGLTPALTVFDIAYSRSESELLGKARQSGCKTISGTEMLLNQGAAAFQIWTGRKAPLEVMRNALAEARAEGD